jgi:excisionase family DNA binding protein
MTASARSSLNKTSRQSSRAVSIVERSAAARLLSILAPKVASDRSALQIVDEGGHRLEVPTALRDVLYRAAELLAGGQAVTVLADEQMFSSQAAAGLLNISRQYLVQLVDAGELAAVKVGTHRRLRLADVEAFKVARDAKRTAALDQLTALSEEVGGYKFDVKAH